MLTSSPGRLAAELARLLRSGVHTPDLVGAEGLLGLAIVRAKSASDRPDDRAAAALGVIAEGALRVDGVRDGPAAVLLGVARGRRGSLLKTRRGDAAALLNIEVEHFRKVREAQLLQAVADEVHSLDAAYRLRHAHRARKPPGSSLGVDWLAQHRAYRRIWTPVWAMRADLLDLQQRLRETPEDHAAIADRLVNVTWRYAQFLREIDRFVEQQGGLWLMSDLDQELEVAEASYGIGYHTPFGEADNSWLRLLLGRADEAELEPFSDLLITAGERRQELMAAWVAWVQACPSNLDAAGDCACELHAWLGCAGRFVTIIDDDWTRVADWYRPGPKGL